jgi:hypothetical protein
MLGRGQLIVDKAKESRRVAKELGVRPSAITLTYEGKRKKVLKKIKADVAAAEKAGYAIESLEISD